MLVAKVLSANEGDFDMRRSLVSQCDPEHLAAAERLSREAAPDQVLDVYLAAAVYVVPKALAKDLGIPKGELRAGSARRPSGCSPIITAGPPRGDRP